jgi:hypothetical protein
MNRYFISGYYRDFAETPEIEFRVEDRNTPEKAKYGTDFRVVLYVNGEWEHEWDNWWSLEQAEEIAAKKKRRLEDESLPVPVRNCLAL